MKDINKFKLSLFNFLDRYQMGNYKTGKDLNVLLIGHRQRMEDILASVIANGQLPDTNLHITVCNTNPDGTIASLMSRAPYLPHFSTIHLNDKPFDTGIDTPEQNLCALSFDKVKLTPDTIDRVIEERIDCRYILISTSNDEKNYLLAEAAARAAWTADTKAVIGYVQEKKPAQVIESAAAGVKAVPFGFEEAVLSPVDADKAVLRPAEASQADAAQAEAAPVEPREGTDRNYSEELRNIARNLHYAYCKSADDQISIQEIDRSFEDEYNYVSNIESAQHLNAKLLACGIAEGNHIQKAAAFLRKLEDAPELVDQLAEVEHNRWVMSKVFAGYSQVENIEQIYQDGNTTHSKKEMWHTCLVRCRAASRIRVSDWEQALSDHYRAELDPLDRITLKIHKQCKVLSDQRRNTIDQTLQNIKSQLGFHAVLTTDFDMLKQAIAEMRMGKLSAVSLYNKYYALLKQDLVQQKHPSAGGMLPLLEFLHTTAAPLCEYAAKKDYKEQDRIFIRSIPFALDNKIGPSLVKLLSDDFATNLLAMKELTPSSITFLGIARTAAELKEQLSQIAALKEYITGTVSETNAAYRVIVPAALYEATAEDRSQLLPVQDWTRSAVQEVFGAVFTGQDHKTTVDYIDVTDADPMLRSAAAAYSQEGSCGTFCIWHGKFRSLFGADALEHTISTQKLTVHDMFRLSGAVPQTVDSGTVVGLSETYKDIWELAHQYSTTWKELCGMIGEKDFLLESFTITHTGTSKTISIPLAGSVEKAFDTLLPSMAEKGWINAGTIKKSVDDNGITTASFNLNSMVHNPKEFEDALKQCNTHFDTPCYFVVEDNKISLYGLSCQIAYGEALNEQVERIHRLLKLLENKKCIRNYTKDEASKTFHFRFSNAATAFIMHSEGRALENYLYYTALTQTDFDDVETGFYFQHTASDDSAENEIDTICTRGQSSVFISAKDRVKETFTKKPNYLNYICYEIKNLADNFGINAKAVLAIPSLEMRNAAGEFTSYFTKCRKRGVYLLGKEAFASDCIGEMLVQIMNGNSEWYNPIMPHENDPVIAADGSTAASETVFETGQVVTFTVTRRKNGGLQGTLGSTAVEAYLPSDQMRGLQNKRAGDSFEVCIQFYEAGSNRYKLRRYDARFDRFNQR